MAWSRKSTNFDKEFVDFLMGFSLLSAVDFFVFRKMEPRETNFGGFVFEGGEEAYTVIDALDHSNIRGDSFIVTRNAVEHIGNNVFMDFDNFDFFKGIKSVTVKGRTHNANDSVHMRIVGDKGEIKRILEFACSEDYVEKTFEVDGDVGRADVKFDFLPDCDFDFVSFQFHAAK